MVPILSTKRLNTRATQPPIVKKPSQKKRKDDDSSKHQDAPSTKCKQICNYKHLDDVNLKEKSNKKYLNERQRMHNLSCPLHKKKFVERYKGLTDKSLIAVFNTKWSVLCCHELLTSTPVVCCFCIYCNCKRELHGDNDDNWKSAPKRSSCEKNSLFKCSFIAN